MLPRSARSHSRRVEERIASAFPCSCPMSISPLANERTSCAAERQPTGTQRPSAQNQWVTCEPSRSALAKKRAISVSVTSRSVLPRGDPGRRLGVERRAGELVLAERHDEHRAGALEERRGQEQVVVLHVVVRDHAVRLPPRVARDDAHLLVGAERETGVEGPDGAEAPLAPPDRHGAARGGKRLVAWVFDHEPLLVQRVLARG